MSLNSFINAISDFLDTIGSFLSFLCSLPTIFIVWFNSFPNFIKDGLLLLLILITTFIVMKIISLFK